MAEIQDSSPAQKVFSLLELVEQIQSHLPLRDLLLSQRICTKFHDVFHSRPKFKQQLHLAPNESRDLTDVLIYVLGWSPFYPHLFTMRRVRNKVGITLGNIADATAEYRTDRSGYWYQLRVIQSVRGSECIV